MTNHIDVNLLSHQFKFLQDYTTPYLLLLGGYGSGKTHAFANKAIYMAYLNPKCCGTIMEPTGPLLQDVLVPSLEEVLDSYKLKYEYESNNKKPNYIIHWGNGETSELRLRSAENWRRQIGSNQAFVGVDEVDTMKPDDALKMIQKSGARIRKGKHRQFFFSTTPEGFGFCYRFFEKQAGADRKTIRARTHDNPFLPEDYIPRLKKMYPANLIDAYLEGRYVNLTSGSVYVNFDRDRNNTDVTEDGREPLHIGMDFNVTKMGAVIHVIRDGDPFAVNELVKVYDTPAMIKILLDRYKDRQIYAYPDASGKNRKTVNASESDLSLLRAAGFRVKADKSNPRVKDRVLSMNAMFMNGDGVVRYRVNVKNCPNYVECLEQQVYDDNGEPEKNDDIDHLPDAGGYFINQRYPVKKKGASTFTMRL